MKFSLPKNDSRSTWIKLGLAAIVLRFFFGLCPSCCEVFYSRGFYRLIRAIYDYSFGFLPFAGIYIFALLFSIWFIPKFIHFVKAVFIRKEGFWGKGYGFSFLAFLSALTFWFLVLWGYNYARTPISDRIGLVLPEAMGFNAVFEEAQYIKNACIQTRNEIPNIDTNAITAAYYSNNLEEEMRELLEKTLHEYGYDISGHVRGRFIQPAGILLRFSSSGVYFPFTGEGHVDEGLNPIIKPFTMTHELAHGYGFGDEAVCNFWAYLACIRSADPAIRYSGYLSYWRYVYSALMEFMTEEDYLVERATISRGMYNDMEAIYATLDQYPPFIPYLQPAIYDIFLKIQGEEDGIKSYSRVVLLVSSWRKKYSKN